MKAFPVSDMNPRDVLVAHHGLCPDGFGAALAAWLIFGNEAAYVPCSYGQANPIDAKGKHLFVLDFSFPPEQMLELEKVAKSVTVLDHHKSARDTYCDYKCSGTHTHLFFDMARSGAMIAWEYFHPTKPVPHLFKYIQDRDLWNWLLEETAAVTCALDSEPFDFTRWTELMNFNEQEASDYMKSGQAMLQKYTSLCEKIAARAQPYTIQGKSGWIINTSGEFASVVGELLYQRTGTFALLWHINENNVVKCSLRSAAGFDALAIAQVYGGGGHAQACAFVLKPDQLGDLLDQKL